MSRVMWLLVFLSLVPSPPEASWQWPTSGPHEILRDFEAPLTPWGPGHRGLDLAASSDKILSPVSGVVSFSGFVVDRPVVTVRTAQGWEVSMEPVASHLPVGSLVSSGEEIGALEAGHCTSLCLHIGLRVEDRYRSPAKELGVSQRAVLLPW